MTAVRVFRPGDAVEVQTRHPRTQAIGWLPGSVVRATPTGRLVVEYIADGRAFRMLTDPVKVRGN
jgi:hypothetical protein